MDAPSQPEPVTVLKKNLQLAWNCRRGVIPMYFPNLSHGVKIRGVRDNIGNQMVGKIARAGYLASSIIQAWEDIEWAKKQGLEPLVDIWERECDGETDAKIPVDEADIMKRKFKAVDGMHRKTAMDHHSSNYTGPADKNPYLWAPICWLYDHTQLGHLANLLASEANRQTEGFVKMSYIDHVTCMAAVYSVWHETIYKPRAHPNPDTDEATKYRQGGASLRKFSHWYHDHMDSSVTPATISVKASVGVRILPKAMEWIQDKALASEVPPPPPRVVIIYMHSMLVYV
jgi:hypothetical protein